MTNLYGMIGRSKMKTVTSRETFLQAAAAFFILLFVYTAASKLMERERFGAVIAASPLVGSYAKTLAWLVPFAEIAVSAMLLFPGSRNFGLLASALLMAVFTAYVAYMIVVSAHLPCSCGGIVEYLSWKQHFYFNLGVMILATLASWLAYRPKLFIAINRES